MASISHEPRPNNADNQPDLRSIIREELRSFTNQNRNRNNFRGQRFPRSNYHQRNNYRVVFGSRDSRTTNGNIICHNCNRVDHYASQCRRRYDPRIPINNRDTLQT